MTSNAYQPAINPGVAADHVRDTIALYRARSAAAVATLEGLQSIDGKAANKRVSEVVGPRLPRGVSCYWKHDPKGSNRDHYCLTVWKRDTPVSWEDRHLAKSDGFEFRVHVVSGDTAKVDARHCEIMLERELLLSRAADDMEAKLPELAGKVAAYNAALAAIQDAEKALDGISHVILNPPRRR